MKLSLAETRDGEKKRTDEIDEKEREREMRVWVRLEIGFSRGQAQKIEERRGKDFTEMVI